MQHVCMFSVYSIRGGAKKKSQARKIEGFVKKQFFSNKFFNISGGSCSAATTETKGN